MMGNAMYRKQATNKEYQSWAGYPDSPVLSGDYPYQSLIWAGGFIRLYCSSAPIKMDAGNDAFQSDNTVVDGHYLLWQYNLSGATWVYNTDGWLGMWITIIDQANHDVCEQDGTTVYFAKTTTTEQDGGSTTSLIRIRNLRHKDGASVVRDKAVFWLEKSVNSSYQQWTGYPANLLVSLSTYPYQYLAISSTNQWSESLPVLVAGIAPFITNQGVRYIIGYEYPETESHLWAYRNGAWVSSGTTGNVLVSQSTVQTNHDIVRDTDRTLMYAKTTTPAQDAGISETLHRINI